MRDADKAIDKLLAGLRDAEPSARFEQRILERMEAGQSVAADSAWSRLLLPWRLRPAIASACVALAALLVASLFVATSTHQHRRAPIELRDQSLIGATPRATAPAATAQKVPTVNRQAASRVSLRRPRAYNGEQTETASLPAPPLPLTEQERLLLRLAHRHDPQNMAILNRDEQATQSVKATEQFQQFFGIKPEEMRIESE